MAGYSNTPLPRKLGIRPGSRLIFDHAPRTFRDEIGPLPEGAKILRGEEGDAELVVAFVSCRKDLCGRFHSLALRLLPTGLLWIAWPKRASGVPSDLDENVVRAIGLAAGWVDTKVCAIDDVWSGLKFVIPLKDRDAEMARRAAGIPPKDPCQ